MAIAGARSNQRRAAAAERTFTIDQGLKERPWFKHQIYAPGAYTGYGVKTIPAVREAMEESKWKEADEGAVMVGQVLMKEASLVDSMAQELEQAEGQPPAAQTARKSAPRARKERSSKPEGKGGGGFSVRLGKGFNARPAITGSAFRSSERFRKAPVLTADATMRASQNPCGRERSFIILLFRLQYAWSGRRAVRRAESRHYPLRPEYRLRLAHRQTARSSETAQPCSMNSAATCGGHGAAASRLMLNFSVEKGAAISGAVRPWIWCITITAR